MLRPFGLCVSPGHCRYSAAAASDGAKPIFSEPYPFFGDNNIGLTRAQALQNPASARDVLCVVGADFVISESTGALFEPLNADGRSVYAMLSDTGELVATSNGVRVTSSENDNSNDPTGAACDENVVAVDETVAIEGRYVRLGETFLCCGFVATATLTRLSGW